MKKADRKKDGKAGDEEPGKDEFEVSEEVKRLSFAVDQREKMLQKYRVREGHPVIKKLLN
jgi:hypothetical protein